MSTLLAPADVRDFIDCDLQDSSLQLLIDDADAEIVKRYGPVDIATETFEVSEWDLASAGWFPWGYPWGEVYPYGKTIWIHLGRPAQSISTVLETVGQVVTTLDPSDYALRDSRRVERLTVTGSVHPRVGWGHRVVITYVPVDDTALRKRVELDLVKLTMQYNGLSSERIGDYANSTKDYQKEREAILSNLRRNLVV